MKKKRRPGKSGLEAIRDQILDFVCTKHDFKLEKDDFLPEGDWNGSMYTSVARTNAGVISDQIGRAHV